MAFFRIKSWNFGCLGVILATIAFFVINISIGAWSIAVILSWFNIVAPKAINCLLGIFFGEFTIPIALIGKLMHFIGLF